VPTYRGSGFVEALPLGGDSLLTLPAGALFTDAQRRPFDDAGYSQGMAFESGTGRVFVSGEAAMFSAQIAVGGMQVLPPDHNQQFLLNILHWFDGLL